VTDLQLAHQLADIAQAISLSRFGVADLQITSKPDLTPVSDADRLAEQKIREHLDKFAPSDGVIGEEFAEKKSNNKRQWILDPIDGTKNFIRGLTIWANLIALRVDGVITTGIVNAPAISRRWYGAAGEGAFVDEFISGQQKKRQIFVSKVSNLSDASFAFAEMVKAGNWEERYDKFLSLTDKVWRGRGFGDFWGHMLVAEGAVDFTVEPKLALWDMAALEIIVKEAGGRFTNITGKDGVDGPGAIASNSLLHPMIVQALN
jgi:histidinol-phosphatase